MGPPRRQARHGVKTGYGSPHLLLKMDKARQDPGREVGGLRVQPLSRTSLKTRRSLGSVVLQAAGLLLEASSVLKRIRKPTRALGARRLGLQEEGRASVLVGGNVSALPPPFPQRIIATALGPTWRRSCHVSFTRSGRGFFPPKPLRFLWVALGRLTKGNFGRS